MSTIDNIEEFTVYSDFENMCGNIFNNYPEKNIELFLEEIITNNIMLKLLQEKQKKYRKNAIIRYLFKKNRKKNIIKMLYINKSIVASNKGRCKGGRFEKKNIN